MASDNRAYAELDDSSSAPSQYGSTNVISNGAAPLATDTGSLKRWKNARRLCWALLAIGLVTVALQVAGCSIAGVYMDWLLARLIAGLWLATLGVVSPAIGLRAFRNPYESSQCWTLSHFIMSIVATVAYGILLLMSAANVATSRNALEDLYTIVVTVDEEEYSEEPEFAQNSTYVIPTTTPSENVTTSTDLPDPTPMLNAIRGELTVCVFLIGATLAYLILSIVSNVIICLSWFGRGGQKSMTIVYMPQDASSTPQTQSITIPSKSKVVVLPASKQEQK